MLRVPFGFDAPGLFAASVPVHHQRTAICGCCRYCRFVAFGLDSLCFSAVCVFIENQFAAICGRFRGYG